MTLQGLIAAAILGIGVGLWLAREPVRAAVSGLFNSGTAGKPTGKRKRGGAVPIVATAVSSGRDDLEFAGVGTARALRHVTLISAVAGEVVKLHTRAGEQLKAGAKIIELDTRQAQLAVEMAQSKLNGAERLLGRADQLRRRRVQSRAKVQDAATIADQARVELKVAEEALADHTITAPFAGTVGIAHVDVGDRVTTTTELITLDDRSRLTVEFEVPEKFLPRLRQNMTLDVRTPGFSERKFAGTIEGIDSRVHPTRRTVAVRAMVDNTDDLLRPGMSFSVDLRLTGDVFPQIPDLALQFSQSGNYVWLVEGGKAKRVDVAIVRRKNNTVLVRGSLSPGDAIVIEGVQRLRAGRAVRIAEEPGRYERKRQMKPDSAASGRASQLSAQGRKPVPKSSQAR